MHNHVMTNARNTSCHTKCSGCAAHQRPARLQRWRVPPHQALHAKASPAPVHDHTTDYMHMPSPQETCVHALTNHQCPDRLLRESQHMLAAAHRLPLKACSAPAAEPAASRSRSCPALCCTVLRCPGPLPARPRSPPALATQHFPLEAPGQLLGPGTPHSRHQERYWQPFI